MDKDWLERFNRDKAMMERDFEQTRRWSRRLAPVGGLIYLVATLLVLGILAVVFYALLRWQGLI
jgi:hypothetical protein